jgi:hypothetical protein
VTARARRHAVQHAKGPAIRLLAHSRRRCMPSAASGAATAATQAPRARAAQVRRRSAAHEELTRRHCTLLAEAAAAGDPCAAPGRLHRALAAALEVRAPPGARAGGAGLRTGRAGGRLGPALLHALNSLTVALARSAQHGAGRCCRRAGPLCATRVFPVRRCCVR